MKKENRSCMTMEKTSQIKEEQEKKIGEKDGHQIPVQKGPTGSHDPVDSKFSFI